VPLGNVNGVLLEGDDGELVLIDAGFPNHESAVFDALSTLGRRPEDLSHIVFTLHARSNGSCFASSGVQTSPSRRCESTSTYKTARRCRWLAG
jgi:hypothetical protein